MEDPKLTKLKDLLKMVDESITRDEFIKSFEAVISFAQKSEERLNKKIDDRMAKVRDGERGEKGDKGDKGNDGKLYIGLRGKNGRDGRDGIDGKDGRNGKDGKDGKDATPETATQIADKLETLEGDARLDVSAIKGFDEFEKRLKGVENRPVGGWSSAGGGKIVKLYDLSDKLDGVTKKFALPAFWRVVLVQSSSTPNAFRPTVDFTTDTSDMSITFTSEINAATTLAAGQTLLVEYAEP